jgi:uncharacterized protein YndB with AHSA1/START domain
MGERVREQAPGGRSAVSVVRASVVVDAPPERVWEVVADPNNLPRWDHHIESMSGVPKGGVYEGARYEAHVRLMGVRTLVKVSVLELTPGKYAKVRLDGLLDGVVETWLEPVEGGATRLRHRVEYRFKGGPLGRLAARGVKLLGAALLLRRGTEAQKLQAEERSA